MVIKIRNGDRTLPTALDVRRFLEHWDLTELVHFESLHKMVSLQRPSTTTRLKRVPDAISIDGMTLSFAFVKPWDSLRRREF